MHKKFLTLLTATLLLVFSIPAFAGPEIEAKIVDPEDNSRFVEFDSVFKSPLIIDIEQFQIHEGSSFLAWLSDDTMANTDEIHLSFKTGEVGTNTGEIHMTADFTTLTGGTLEVIEGGSWTAETGSAVDIFNRKRETSMDSSTLQENQNQATFVLSDELIAGVTSPTGGTAILSIPAFGATPFARNSGNSYEFVLKESTAYTIKFTSTAASNAAAIILTWYERIPG